MGTPTVGPWTYEYMPIEHVWSIFGANGKFICSIKAESDTDEDKANVELIIEASKTATPE